MVQDQATNGIARLVAETGAKVGVEILNVGLRLDAVSTALIEPDIVVVFIKIVFVLDVADDLFENVFDGNQTADAGVLVEHHRHVVV